MAGAKLPAEQLSHHDVIFPVSFCAGPTACRSLQVVSKDVLIAVKAALPLVDRQAPKLLYMYGDEPAKGSQILRYNTVTDAWDTLKVQGLSVPAPRLGAVAAGLQGRLLVCGGCAGLDGLELAPPLQSVYAFQPCLRTWAKLPDMNCTRFRATGCPLGADLAICGGSNWSSDFSTECSSDFSNRSKKQILDRAEVFQSGVWKQLPSMIQRREGAVAGTVAGGDLLVCGGFDGFKELASAEIFRHGSWQQLPPMRAARHGAIGASIKGVMYVCGGVLEGEIASTERFDPMNAYWETLQSMTCDRRGAAGASVEGKLFVFGGESFLSSAVAGFLPTLILSAERFDPKDDAWDAVAPLTSGRRFFAMAAVAQ